MFHFHTNKCSHFVTSSLITPIASSSMFWLRLMPCTSIPKTGSGVRRYVCCPAIDEDLAAQTRTGWDAALNRVLYTVQRFILHIISASKRNKDREIAEKRSIVTALRAARTSNLKIKFSFQAPMPQDVC